MEAAAATLPTCVYLLTQQQWPLLSARHPEVPLAATCNLWTCKEPTFRQTCRPASCPVVVICLTCTHVSAKWGSPNSHLRHVYTEQVPVPISSYIAVYSQSSVVTSCSVEFVKTPRLYHCKSSLGRVYYSLTSQPEDVDGVVNSSIITLQSNLRWTCCDSQVLGP
ncbi:hypothetical protein F5141DRAFT_311494 [Pisolithus sp. B1]|nr:hypothetical protein F5141DRAFT_311494 [Pisolithus sp. B1]